MRLPPIVIRVQLGSSFCGHTLQMTLVYVTSCHSTVVWYVIIDNGLERVSAFNSRFGWVRCAGANALAEAAEFTSI